MSAVRSRRDRSLADHRARNFPLDETGRGANILPMISTNRTLATFVGLSVVAVLLLGAGVSSAPAQEWVSIFSGKDLSGWTPKIKGYELGDNFAKTFRVENGAICVRYDGYDNQFKERFGHLFYKSPYSNYVIRLEYRFVGQQLPDGPGWALRNSGIMVHCQKPETIRKDQDFPVCIEVQLLGGDGKNPRHTGNMCSPGTHVVMNGKLITQHCVDSRSETYHGEHWVKAEAEVHGNGLIIHRINGQPVLEYEKAQLDPGDADAQKIIKETGEKMLYGGYISLQSESHPVEFRNIEIRQLSE